MSAKQDRTAPRTAADIERKYDLGRLSGADKQSTQLSQLTQMMAQFIATTNAQFAKLEKMVTELVSALYKKGDTFYVATGHTLASFGMKTETICVIKTITGNFVDMQAAGTYHVAFYGWADDKITAELDIVLANDLPTKLSVGDKVYFFQNETGVLCLAYAVESSNEQNEQPDNGQGG